MIKINKMKSLIQILNENEILNYSMYYHGTSNEENGIKIINQGIKPGVIKTSRKKGAPVAGRVYLTPDLKTGIIYCIGANMIGQDLDVYLEREGRYGYLFCISRNKLLNNIQPDEDCIGYLLHYVFTGKYFYDIIDVKGKDFSWLKSLAENYLTKNQIYKVLRDYDDFDLFQAGKKLVKYMTEKQKWQIIQAGSNIAYDGIIIPDMVYKFDKLLNPKLKTNGSNFFKLAEKIK